MLKGLLGRCGADAILTTVMGGLDRPTHSDSYRQANAAAVTDYGRGKPAAGTSRGFPRRGVTE